MPRSTSSVHRRHRLANTIFSLGHPAMRPCAECVRRDLFCIVHESSELCEQCKRFGRVCNLASPVTAIEKLARQENDILSQISLAHKVTREAEAKVARLRKQRRLLLKKIKDFGDREAQNIFELKVEEIVAKVPPLEFLFSDPPLSNSFQVSQGFPHKTPASPLCSG
jgi:hypothetical protein